MATAAAAATAANGTTAAAKDEQAAHRFAKDQLKAFVERIERLEEEKKAIADDVRDVYAEAKGNGYDVKARSRRRFWRPTCTRSACWCRPLLTSPVIQTRHGRALSRPSRSGGHCARGSGCAGQARA
jgi:Uncharacterized protein conserved in bacteria (DUF2312)